MNHKHVRIDLHTGYNVYTEEFSKAKPWQKITNVKFTKMPDQVKKVVDSLKAEGYTRFQFDSMRVGFLIWVPRIYINAFKE